MKKKSKFSLALKEYRIRKGMTQMELSERTGLSRPVISNLESGNQTPTMRHIVLLKEKCGLDLSETVYNDDKSDGPSRVDDVKVQYGLPADMTTDVLKVMEHFNKVQEARKEIAIVQKMLGEIAAEKSFVDAQHLKQLEQIQSILIRVQTLL